MLDELKRAWGEKPTETAIGIASIALMGVKILDTLSGVQSKRAYAKSMNQRAKRMK